MSIQSTMLQGREAVHPVSDRVLLQCWPILPARILNGFQSLSTLLHAYSVVEVGLEDVYHSVYYEYLQDLNTVIAMGKVILYRIH